MLLAVLNSICKFIFSTFMQKYKAKVVAYEDKTFYDNGNKTRAYYPIIEYIKDIEKYTYKSKWREKPNQLYTERNIYITIFGKPFSRPELKAKIIRCGSMFICLFYFYWIILSGVPDINTISGPYIPSSVSTIVFYLLLPHKKMESILFQYITKDVFNSTYPYILLSSILLIAFLVSVILFVKVLYIKSLKKHGSIKKGNRAHTIYYEKTHTRMSTFEFRHNGKRRIYQMQDFNNDKNIDIYYDEKRDVAYSDLDITQTLIIAITLLCGVVAISATIGWIMYQIFAN